MKLPSGRSGSCRPAPGAAHRVGYGRDGVVLADDALPEPILHPDELLDLALDEPADRDVRPLADDGGDVLFVHLFLEHARACSRGGLAAPPQLLLELGEPSVLQLRRARVVPLALRPLDLVPQRFELAL